MGSKTYCSGQMVNLNTSAEEMRWERLSMLESSMAHGQHLMFGQKLSENQLAGSGTTYRNFVYWARNYKLSGYNNNEILKNYDITFNEMYQYFEPIVSAPIELDEEQEAGFLEDTLKLPSGVEELDSTTVTVMGQMPDGTFKEVTVTGKARLDHRVKVVNSYLGSYDSERLGDAYAWSQYDQYMKDSPYIQMYILSDGAEQGYQIIAGNNLDLEDSGAQAGSYEDCWLCLGNAFDEPHVDDETGENVITNQFNIVEQVYLPLKSSIPSYSMYFAIWGYAYDITELDANEWQFNGDYLALNSNGEPISLGPVAPNPDGTLPEPAWKVAKSKIEVQLETYNSDEIKTFESEINLASVKGFGYIQDKDVAANDPNIGSLIPKDLEAVDSFSPPIIPFMNDKGWMDDTWQPSWEANIKAGKKVTGDKEYFTELHKTLKEQIQHEDVAWVFLIYGIPVNYAQTHEGAHYILQFFKQMSISNWVDFKHGDTGSAQGHEFYYKFGIRLFNCTYQIHCGGSYYECGTGMCPVPGYSDIRPGEAGVTWYNNNPTIWVQHQSNSWEYITVWDVFGEFPSIKNGVGHELDCNFFLPIWKTIDVERQYSPTLVPLAWCVGKNIPYSDWTNLYQFAPNVAVTSYKVVKTKWYQTTLFKVILIIIIIVITVIVSYFCPPAGGAMAKAGASIAAYVGVGSTAFWTAVVTVAVAVAVSVVVNAIITPMLTKAFGNTIGNILGAIISIVISVYLGGGNMSSALDSFMSPMTWVSIGQAALKGMAQDIQEKMAQLRQEAKAFMEHLNDKTDELNALKAEMGITEQNEWAKQQVRHGATKGNALDECTVETADNFIARCITNVINCIPNSQAVLEYYAQMSVDTKTVPTVMFGGAEAFPGLA